MQTKAAANTVESRRARAEKTRDRVEALRAEFEDELAMRAELIVECDRAGDPVADIARWIGVSPTRVRQVIAGGAL